MKGMAHTPFAIFAVTMLLILFMVPLNSVPEEARQDVIGSEAANAQAHNFESTLIEGLGITAADYLEASNRYVVDQGFVPDAEAALDFEGGEFDGEQINFTTYSEWVNGLDSKYDNRGISIDLSYSNLDVDEGLKARGGADLQYNFSRSSVDYSFDDRVEGLAGLQGPDPLLANASSGSFTPQYGYCGFDTPAHHSGTGSSSSGEVAQGYAAVRPDDVSGVDFSDPRILVTQDASQYSSTDLSSFNGVIAATQGTIEDGDYARVSGLNVSSITEADSIIIDGDQVWKSYFREILDHDCYVKNSNAPGAFNRMEGSFSASDQGLTTFIGDQSGSTEVNEAYLYYEGSSVSNSSISGVTSGDYVSDDRPWFRLADNNIAEWNLDGLIE